MEQRAAAYGEAALFVTYTPANETQKEYAVSFLAAHPHTKLVTITIGGDDLLLLQDSARSSTPGTLRRSRAAILPG